MKPAFSILLSLSAILCCVLVLTSFNKHNQGQVLFGQYFEATPPEGYGLQRSLRLMEGNDADQSILHQGIIYHQQKDYDLALVSFRAYLESNPLPADYQPQLLAATAAMATGRYAEAAAYLKAMPQRSAAAEAANMWFSGLLDLHDENLEAAHSKLRLLSLMENDGGYPVQQIIADF